MGKTRANYTAHNNHIIPVPITASEACETQSEETYNDVTYKYKSQDHISNSSVSFRSPCIMSGLSHKQNKYNKIQETHESGPPAALSCRNLKAPANKWVGRGYSRPLGWTLALKLSFHIKPLALFSGQVRSARISLEVFDNHRDEECQYTHCPNQVVHKKENGIMLRSISLGLHVSALYAHGSLHNIDPAF